MRMFEFENQSIAAQAIDVFAALRHSRRLEKRSGMDFDDMSAHGLIDLIRRETIDDSA